MGLAHFAANVLAGLAQLSLHVPPGPPELFARFPPCAAEIFMSSPEFRPVLVPEGMVMIAATRRGKNYQSRENRECTESLHKSLAFNLQRWLPAVCSIFFSPGSFL